MNGDGGEVLWQVFLVDLFEFYFDILWQFYVIQVFIVFNIEFIWFGVCLSMGFFNFGECWYIGVDCCILCKILVFCIEDYIYWGVLVEGYSEDVEGVLLIFFDGIIVWGDLFVIVDGICLVLCDQCFFEIKVIFIVIKGIDFYVCIFYMFELLVFVFELLYDSMDIVVDGKGNCVLLGFFQLW